MKNSIFRGFKTQKTPTDMIFGILAIITLHAKIQNDRPNGASQHIGEISLSYGF